MPTTTCRFATPAATRPPSKPWKVERPDAGALDETVYRSMISEGKVDGSKVRIFLTSPPFVDYVWVPRKPVAQAPRETFAKAFLSLKEGKDDAILNILRGKDFVRADDAEYANIRKIASDLKML